MDSRPAGEPVTQVGVIPCSGERETGAYFQGSGGYVELGRIFCLLDYTPL